MTLANGVRLVLPFFWLHGKGLVLNNCNVVIYNEMDADEKQVIAYLKFLNASLPSISSRAFFFCMII